MSQMVAFSGTRFGMTEAQEQIVEELLSDFLRHTTTLLHGCCVESDEKAAQIAKSLGMHVWAYPATGVDPKWVSEKAKEISDVVHEPLPPLVRNMMMVDRAGCLIATPKQNHSIRRSGTWYTVRYARDEAGKTAYVVMPDGEVRLA